MKTVLTFIIIITTFTFGNSNAQNLKSDDPLNGPKKEYHANGKISREYIMTNGVPNGPYKSYSESGVLLSVQNLLDGIPHGIKKHSSKTVRFGRNITWKTESLRGLQKNTLKMAPLNLIAI